MSKFEPVLQEVADKILHDLPEEVAVGVSFKLHEGGDALVLAYPSSLHGTPDMQLLDGVVRRFGGAFVSRGKGNSFYLIPKPKPVAEKPMEEPKPAAPAETPKPVDAKTAEPEKPTPPQEQPNPPEQFKQPSPISIYRGKYCSACEDQGTCRLPSNAAQMQLCVRMLELQFLDGIAERLFKLGQTLEGVDARLSALTAKISVPVPQQPKPSTTLPPQQPPKVQRDTNPREGFEEDGLVWVKVFDGAELKYLKATEKDNSNRPRFKELIRFIEGKGDKPYAKLPFLGEDCNCFLWVFNQGPAAIGKKKCRTPSGGRR
jgi:hypothetical protein